MLEILYYQGQKFTKIIVKNLMKTETRLNKSFFEHIENLNIKTKNLR